MTKTKWYATAAVGLIVVSATAPANAKDGVRTGEDGITLKAGSGDFELTLGGRLHLDAVKYTDDAGPDDSSAKVRRARIELSGRVARIIRFRVDREFANGGGWRNLWLGIEPVKNLEIRGGNLIVPFSMEELQSSNKAALMERSYVSALAPGFSLGGMASYGAKNFTVSAGWFGNALDSEDSRSVERGKGFAGRVTFAPIVKRHSFAHLAVSAESRNLDSSDSLRFSAKPGSEFAPTLFRTGNLLGADKLRSHGGEAAYGNGPFMIMGQYARTKVGRDFLNDLDFNAWYVQASFVPFGGKYGYSRGSGTVSGVDVRKRGHALELAARVTGIDVNDDNLRSGTGHMITLGANYYWNRNVRFMVNAARSKADDVGLLGTDRRIDVVTGRFQIAF